VSTQLHLNYDDDDNNNNNNNNISRASLYPVANVGGHSY
jgi:hypothetical protein